MPSHGDKSRKPQTVFSRRALLCSAAHIAGSVVVSAAFPVASALGEPRAAWLVNAARIARAIQQPPAPRAYSVAPLTHGHSPRQNHGILQHAILRQAEAGGGRVIVPSGEWLIAGPLRLVSHIDLHISEGATLSFVDDRSYHLPPVLSRWEGTDMIGYSPYLYAYNATDIALTGPGTLDGNGSSTSSTFMRNEGSDIDRLREMGRNGTPVSGRVFAEGHSLRPPFIQFYSCSRVLIDGVRIEDFPFWGLHLLYSNNVTVRNLSVRSFASNNDGIDVDSCSDVLVERCIFQTKDDCIAIKSGRDADGRNVARPSHHIVIRDCRMIYSGSSGVAIGSEMSGGIHDVFILQCTMDQVEQMLTVKSNLDRGGAVEGIRAWDIDVNRCDHLLVVTTAYHSYSGGYFPPRIHDIALSDITCKRSQTAFILEGHHSAPISALSLYDVHVQHADTALLQSHVVDLSMDNIVVNGKRLTNDTTS